jgi:hypothetical protein
LTHLQRVANLGSYIFLVLRFSIITNQQDLLKAMRRNRYWGERLAIQER